MKQSNLEKTKYVSKIGVLSALAALLMLLEIPLWFAPGFYKLDFSDIVALLGGFSLGPVAGVLIELIKNLLKLLIKGSGTGYVGELANFLTGCSLVLPAAILYRFHKQKTKKHAIIGMIVGCVSFVICGALFNYFILIPFFSFFLHLPMDQIISMGAAVNSHITSLSSFVLYATIPFNLLKGIADAVIVTLIYPYVSPVLKR